MPSLDAFSKPLLSPTTLLEGQRRTNSTSCGSRACSLCSTIYRAQDKTQRKRIPLDPAVSPVDGVGVNVNGRNRRVSPGGNVAELHAVVRVGRHHDVLGRRVELHVPGEREIERGEIKTKVHVVEVQYKQTRKKRQDGRGLVLCVKERRASIGFGSWTLRTVKHSRQLAELHPLMLVREEMPLFSAKAQVAFRPTRLTAV